MKLLKPKKAETVTKTLELEKRTHIILDLFQKYSGYSEDEIVDHVILEMLKEHEEFVDWISEQRSIKKFVQSDLVQQLTPEQQRLFENYSDEEAEHESNEKACS